jgi:hypothetical protein
MTGPIVKNPRTDVDVALLRDVFPDLLPDGREVTHSQIEAALRTTRITPRYKNVVGKWRKQVLQERGVWLDGMYAHGRGFVCLTPDEMVRFGNRGVRQAGRKIRKALMVASTPDDVALSEEMRKYRGLLTVAMEKIARDHKSILREVSKSLAPMKQLPRKAS